MQIYPNDKFIEIFAQRFYYLEDLFYKFFASNLLFQDIRYTATVLHSAPSRVRNLRKMRNFWANFTDFEPEINIIKCKTEKLKKLEYFNARL